MTLKQFLFGNKPSSDRQEIKVALYNKRMELLRLKTDSLMQLMLAEDSLRFHEDKFLKIGNEEDYDKVKYQEAKGSVDLWKDEVQKVKEMLAKQDAGFRIIDERYRQLDSFTKQILEDVFI